MAKKITDLTPGNNVVQMKRGRGRPKGSGKAPPAAEGGETAPGFGLNAPDQPLFLSHVNSIREQMGAVEVVKTALKNAKGTLKDRRKLAQAEGLVMRELDEALDALETENVDLLDRETRRRLYFEWLGLPVLSLGKKAATAAAKPADDWFRRGDQAGRLGEERKAPEGCPPEHIQDWLKGHEAGSALRTDKVAAVSARPVSGAPEGAERPSGILVLAEDAFLPGTELEDANLKTLQGDRMPEFNRAERVVALFGARRRILKEEDAACEGGFYVDRGEASDEISEVEVAASEPVTADLT